MKLSECCEVVLFWSPTVIFCGEPTVAGYPASGGGWMALCEEHVQPHLRYAVSAEAIRFLQAEGLDFSEPSIVETEAKPDA